MDKLSIFKTARQKFRDHVVINRHYRQAQYQDQYLEAQKRGGAKIPFGYNNAMLGHMMELRMWYLAYAPGQENKLLKMQELHRLNGELDYRIANALYYRIFAGVLLLFYVRKVRKDRFLGEAQDSHDIDMKDTTATM